MIDSFKARRRLLHKKWKSKTVDVKPLGGACYLVSSDTVQGKYHFINYNLRTCSCFSRMGYCWHIDYITLLIRSNEI